MDNDKVIKLKNLLLNSQDQDPSKVRGEAKNFLKSINAQELIFAEQELLKEGLKPESLSTLCAAHLELLEEDLDSFKNTLKDDHPVKTLMLEHEVILRLLDELEEATFLIQKSKKYEDINPKLISRLKEITSELIESESHYQREEEALFPEALAIGLFGPPQIMINEHKKLRALKKIINDITNSISLNEYRSFKYSFISNTNKLIQSLRDHIYKENNILFPAALQAIPKKNWIHIKKVSDNIGYCSFTPLKK